MRQKDDLQFAQLLNRLRYNAMTAEDMNVIHRCMITETSENYPHHAPHLFTQNSKVDAYNNQLIEKLEGEKVTVNSVDTVLKDYSKELKEKLLRSLSKADDVSKTANLMQKLILAVGMIYDISVNVDVSDGLTNGSSCKVELIERRMEGILRPSIVWVNFLDSAIGKTTRKKYKHLFHDGITEDWTPIFEVQRSFVLNYNTFQRIQFPLRPAAGKTVHKAQGCTVDEIVIDLSQTKVRKNPHIHYVALSRVRSVDHLHILNFNEQALAMDDQVVEEMERMKKEAPLQLCYVPLYQVDLHSFKIAFNNCRSLHKHFPQIHNEPNIVASDVVGFSETRLTSADIAENYQLQGYTAVFNHESTDNLDRRPYHGTAIYVKNDYKTTCISKWNSGSMEFIIIHAQLNQSRDVQVVLIYKYPSCSFGDFKQNVEMHIKPLIDDQKDLVFLGDFNFDLFAGHTDFLTFMEKGFNCKQIVHKTTHDSGSKLDLIFTNISPCRTDVIEAYWSDHKMVILYYDDRDYHDLQLITVNKIQAIGVSSIILAGLQDLSGLKRSVATLLALAAIVLVLGAPDNRGTEFIIGFMENNGVSINVELFVTTSRTTTVSVTVDSPKCTNPRISESFSVTAGQVKQLFFSPSIRMAGSSKSSKGIRVKASDEVVIYGVNKERYSCDGFVGLPIDVLSDEYYLVTWYPPSKQSELLVVGVQDSTSVSITVTQHIGSKYINYAGKNYYKGNVIKETIHKYDTWHLVTSGDLTGSYVKSTKPVSVFSGNRKTNIGRGGSSDHLVEQMFPVNTWGKTFATVPIPKRTVGDYFKFIASEDITKVTISGGYSSSFTISKAGYMVQKLISSKAYCKIVADKPIMVVQFVQSQQSSSEKSDPAMMIIPPVEQYGADYTFTTPKYSLGSYNNYFMFIIEESKASGLRIDGKNFPTNTKFNKISGTNLIGGYISISEGTHTVRHTSPIAIFGGFLYGQANYETYGFTTGMRMAKVNAICIPTPTVTGDGIDNDCDGKIDEELCTPENKNKDDDGDGKINEDCAKPPPVDGSWASWTSYGACSVTCQPTSGTVTGTKTRTRTCSNPAPAYDGKQCAGPGTQTSSCSPTNPCRVDGNWGSWGSYGACSVTCGSGSKSRSRSCNNPAPAGGGSYCAGSSTSTATCTLSACPIDGKWGSWGSYGSCSKTCGGGTQSRSRSCSNPAPQHGGKSCPGSTSSSQNCNTHNCPIDGNWASWGSYGACSLTCGGGVQSRSRTCTNPAPQYQGKSCSGSSTSSRSCNTHNCPIDGFWAGWGSWATCTETCGGGVQSRSRSCSNPTPQYGGAYCSGFSSDTQRCNTHNCPIHGGWGSWGSWGTCTVTCGGGSQRRSRSCSNPTPQYGGLTCPGSSSSSQSCNTQNCPIDGGFSNWGTWGTCTVTCGGGTQVRRRSCSNPAPQYGGALCSGAISQNQNCNTQVCIIDGAWSQWGAWGTCSVSCGGGKRSRARTCTDPKPANGGKSCLGDSSVLEDCNSQACPTPAAGAYVQLCPTGWFTCQSGGITCIDKTFMCDCASDCDDGSDESTGYAGCSGAVIAMCEENSSGTLLISPLAFLTLLIALIFNILH
ncbi:uncharacterized protein LOC133193009 [Saccostrea echinata]|uniref:uncharacterized protein LOC133193009 n=1 Tax=Saccostrea echinata TaxID=191078 RepID=UPI002A83A764|nr:uncharacterized protein LOC133193009 [Saccostrea echinata]